ncbi:hypothetical protein RIR_jg23579.t1 [Rhizophagus irregularis DAOM 181602=DAOM 197198]|nr:hypothetical protein RIR_jg23579.t1 [Rhizophagus irregularis DAOM 181602=DAOM 197198]
METWTRDEAERPGFKRTNYVLSTYSILEETEWYTIESIPNSNFETRILEIVGNRRNNWIDQSMSVFNNTSIA